MDLTRLSYLHLVLENKFKCRHSIRFLKLGNICIYNLKSIAKVTK